MVHPAFHRLQLLVGERSVELLQTSRVIVFGIGGVGSWCAEALARSGVGHLTLVDSDEVCITNVNRQLQATSRNVGRSKVEELKARLLSLHPKVTVEAVHGVYAREHADRFALEHHDYVIDAIDSYANKLDLIEHAHRTRTRLFSSMGAASHLDPTRIRTASIWEARICPFAKIVRKGLRRRGFEGDCLVVYSEEPALEPVEATSVACGTHKCFCPKPEQEDHVDWCSTKRVINGSAVHVTATFGMTLAGLVVQDAHARAQEEMALAGAVESVPA
jgi:tRNA A37 threonylcarbamoyladenosine dehydratase